jgi:ABC-type Zn2+ transport system substrate-binding protein/surface adhesin
MIWVGNNHSEAALMITLREAAEASLSASVKAEHYVKADIQESLTDPQNIVPTQVAYEFYSERLATNE